MSCRVLGRQLELAALSVLVEEAVKAGVTNIVGRYAPTAKNSQVSDHYAKIGFIQTASEPGGGSVWLLDGLDSYKPATSPIGVRKLQIDQGVLI
jgi:predicted enzyme involved in methoxymalonyl-ACP biosynthesis